MPIQWRHEPPPASNLPELVLRRLHASETFHGTITCTRVASCIVHFYGGRTLPCLGDDCPGCKLGRDKRRECYISLERRDHRTHGILGVTLGAERNLADKAPNWANVRGLEVTIRRKGRKANGQVSLDVHGQTLETHRLPPAPELMRHLFHLWGLDSEQMSEDHPLFAYQRDLILTLDSDNGNRQRKTV
jgi:hypothetical protein